LVGVVEGSSLPDVEPAPSEVDVPRQHDYRDDHAPSDSDARALPAPRKRRRSPALTVFRLLGRLWVPLIILIVVGAGGMTVSRLHAIFGSDKSLSYADTKQEATQPINPKMMRYEIFGPPGTTADVSYFDGTGSPAHADGVTLPWSLEFPIVGAAGIGSIAAQGDSDSLGCRIIVDGKVKSEKIATHEISTFTSCALKAA
jgi:hypothetical protein